MELRKVWYPWHSLYGRQVVLRCEVRKCGVAFARCSLDESRDLKAFELPQWMLDQSYCALLKLADRPHVDWRVLVELRLLLNEVVSGVEQRHLSLPNGGVHAEELAPPANDSVDSLRSAPADAAVGQSSASRESRGNTVSCSDAALPPASNRRAER